MKRNYLFASFAALALAGSSAYLAPHAMAASRAPEKEDDETVIKLDDAPAAVKAAVAKLTSNVTKMTKESEDGETTYEAEYKDGDVECSVSLTASGDVIEMEKAIPASQLPAAAAEALKNKYSGATVGEITAVQKTVYEVKITEGGKTREIKIDPRGKVKDKADKEKEEKDEKDEKEEKGEKK